MKKKIILITIASIVILSSCLSRKLRRIDDKFTGETTIISSTLTGFLMASIPAAIVVSKTIRPNGDNIYVMNLNADGSTLITNEKGVKILFTDGSKLEFEDANINVSSGSGLNWSYTSTIILNEEQVNLFIRKKVEAIRLYIFDRHLLDSEKNNLPKIFEKLKNTY